MGFTIFWCTAPSGLLSAISADGWVLEQASLFRVTSLAHKMPTMLFVKLSLLFDQLAQRISEKLSLMELLRSGWWVASGSSPDPLSDTAAGLWEVCHSSPHHTQAPVRREA